LKNLSVFYGGSAMVTTLDKIYKEAMNLPDESKVLLAERLVDYLETHASSALERTHLDTVKRRRDETRSGQIEAINGEDALAQARRILDK
jgi:hypothetical protein